MVRGQALRIEATSTVSFILLWYVVTGWILPSADPMISVFFPSPDKVARAFFHEFSSPAGLTLIMTTLWRFVVGFVASAVLGVTFGLLLGAIPVLQRCFDPLIGFFRSLPGATLIPVVTLFLGLGDASKIVLIISATIWPILVNTIDGVRRIDPAMHETAAAYQIGPWFKVWRVLLPAAAPFIAVGMRVAVSVGLVVTIISELVGASTGIGGYLMQAQAGFALPELWATLMLLGLLGYLLNGAFALVEKRALAWYRGSRGTGDHGA